MNEPQWLDSEWREAHLAAARLCAYAAGREAGRKEAAERLGILEGSEVWHMMTDGNDLQEAMARSAEAARRHPETS